MAPFGSHREEVEDVQKQNQFQKSTVFPLLIELKQNFKNTKRAYDHVTLKRPFPPQIIEGCIVFFLKKESDSRLLCESVPSSFVR